MSLHKKKPLSLNRRNFIKTASLAAGAATFGVPALLRGQNLNSKLNIAVIGAGAKSKGSSDTDCCNTENIFALCDVDADRCASRLEKYPGAKFYQDHRRMFDEIGTSIDAVNVATPDHFHAIAASAVTGARNIAPAMTSEANDPPKNSRDSMVLFPLRFDHRGIVHSEDERGMSFHRRSPAISGEQSPAGDIVAEVADFGLPTESLDRRSGGCQSRGQRCGGALNARGDARRRSCRREGARARRQTRTGGRESLATRHANVKYGARNQGGGCELIWRPDGQGQTV
ncbi:MAG: twin-arginine translocation signal domain-containing protein [Verrucomicrobiota bacterium]